MPALLLRFAPHFVGVLAIIGAYLYVDAQGYQRAQADQAALELRLSEKIGEAVTALDGALDVRLSTIRNTDRTVIQPVITREISNDPRYRSDACALTPGVLDALNRSRALTAPAGADGGGLSASSSAD